MQVIYNGRRSGMIDTALFWQAVPSAVARLITRYGSPSACQLFILGPYPWLEVDSTL